MLVSLNYRNRNSLIDLLDPRARWVFSLLVLFAIVLFWDVRFLAFFFALSVGQFLLARLSWQESRRAWVFMTALVVMTVLVNTLITSAGSIGEVMVGGHTLVSFEIPLPLIAWRPVFTITVERLWFGLAQMLRIFAIGSLFLVLPFTLDPRAYGATFKGLGLPDRLAFTLDLAFRFIPTLSRDFAVTLDAQRARGYEIERGEGGLVAQVRRVAPLVIPVTMNSILTGEDIANAMDLRCFGLRARSWIVELKYRWYDYALMAFGAALLIGGLVLRHVYGIGEFWVPAFLYS